jgi:hypothetical protein
MIQLIKLSRYKGENDIESVMLLEGMACFAGFTLGSRLQRQFA